MHGPSSYRASKQERGRALLGVPTPTPPRQPAKEYTIGQKKERKRQEEKGKVKRTKSRKIKSNQPHSPPTKTTFLPRSYPRSGRPRAHAVDGPKAGTRPLPALQDDQAARAKTTRTLFLQGRQEPSLHRPVSPPGQARTHRPLCYRASKTRPKTLLQGKQDPSPKPSSRASKDIHTILLQGKQELGFDFHQVPSLPSYRASKDARAILLQGKQGRSGHSPTGQASTPWATARARAASRRNDAFLLAAASALPRLACPGRDVGAPSARKIRPRPTGAQGAARKKRKKKERKKNTPTKQSGDNPALR